MFSVIFEVHPHTDRKDEYLTLGKQLKPILEGIDGFIDNERFESLMRPGWVLSHSSWRDEKSLVRWRAQGEHHAVQRKGRDEVFEDYHLRIGEVIHDSAPQEPSSGSQRFDETEAGIAKVVSFTELTPQDGIDLGERPDELLAQIGLKGSPGLVEHDLFASIYNPGKLALLASWRDADVARAFVLKPVTGVTALRHRTVRIIRDYGRFDRREAPQYFPPVSR
ncbi:Antibiotic biosynthesis monooxygenase [Bosea sp. 62]|uniref:antibiotic biosynthesis monooxygenase family protein n=1 Tax=unclassified Bosea (in: a-proteobacteria) TaxID=2653178 RepID=UPI0012577555|nr:MULTISPECIES: antibiotic biosynthesis monooxygenase [unclassified Bosea (in: a-proteobacteria)]CAD5267088.1 Antibiotic biosynthesis monooxygenase [Bosea sp. 46]CAD5268692.1 Antibiotic biosynthesis monooxygenase [Bosea sp. 21B]CAD5269951.1 Antibiotic biosynthesis monooxygenase [Bosea sp. 7B]VVT62442.1 Antibiotic biosynthesis monooxygenase [Bosea sp. EC-HK365B]VXB93085.1 Antibiotic biosynthesis monooxygenase [Bosea sp. 29B]